MTEHTKQTIIKTNRIKKSTSDIVIDTINTILLLALCVITLYPFINTAAVAFNDAVDSVRGGIYLWPREFTLRNFEVIFTENKLIPIALLNSATRAILGASTSVFACMMLAFALSQKEFIGRKFFSRMLVFTMYISGGLIPSLVLMTTLRLNNTYWVYILPGMVVAYNVMVMRTYISGIPESINEAARIDGANEFRLLFSIIYPLAVPVIATIVLFVAVSQWNAWFDTMLYNSSKPNLTTLQFELQKLLSSTRTMTSESADIMSATDTKAPVTTASIRAAMTIIAVVPILATYPFLQKYFVQGLTLGGVKG